MKRYSLPLIALFLSACAGAPTPEVTGATETVEITREVFFKGMRGGALPDSEPTVGAFVYDLTCGPAPDGASIATRAPRAVAIVNQTNERVTIPLFNNMVKSGQARRANPELVRQLNCSIRTTDIKRISDDPVDVMAFLVKNNLMNELTR